MIKNAACVVVLTTILTALSPTPALAQQFAIEPVEVFFGAGFARFDVRNEIGEDIPAQTAAGLQTDATYYLREQFGLVAEFGWIDADIELPESFEPVRALHGSHLSLLLGGRARFFAGERLQLRVHGMIGGARQDSHANIGVGINIPALTGTALSFAFGGSFDIALHDDVAIRIQPDLLITTHENNPTSLFRLAFGVVF